MPVVGAVVGGIFDTALMNKVIDYADIFYNKRFILEKNARINSLIDEDRDDGGIIDVFPEDIIEVEY